MKVIIKNSRLKEAEIYVPGSKSHTIRSVFFASLAEGTSLIKKPLMSDDTISAIKVCRGFGAKIDTDPENNLVIKGFGGKPQIPDNVLDTGNSGTTLRFAASTAALADGYTVLTGDESVRTRLMGNLLISLEKLGAVAVTAKNNGKAPVIVKGVAKGGETEIDGVTSQFLSSLLIHAPLMKNGVNIKVTRLNEAPYAQMTLWWLDRLGIKYTSDNMKSFYIPGGQEYKSFDMTIPGDFSSATFFMVLAAISGTRIKINNLDMKDTQGDRIIPSILEKMGAVVTYGNDSITIKGNVLKGMDIDMNEIPDALPAMAVAACFAQGRTRLLNVPQARFKETDRIKVMHDELTKMGADITELEDGLVINGNNSLNYCHSDRNNSDSNNSDGNNSDYSNLVHNNLDLNFSDSNDSDYNNLDCNNSDNKVEGFKNSSCKESSFKLKGSVLKGHGDHRIVMSLSIAACMSKGISEIDTAEACSVTFPEFFEMLGLCGASLSLE